MNLAICIAICQLQNFFLHLLHTIGPFPQNFTHKNAIRQKFASSNICVTHAPLMHQCKSFQQINFTHYNESILLTASIVNT